MLNEEKLSGKLQILRIWVSAIISGEFETTPEGLFTMGCLIEDCRADAVHLETIMASPSPEAKATVELARARLNVDRARRSIVEAQDSVSRATDGVILAGKFLDQPCTIIAFKTAQTTN